MVKMHSFDSSHGQKMFLPLPSLLIMECYRTECIHVSRHPFSLFLSLSVYYLFICGGNICGDRSIALSAVQAGEI